MHHKTKEAALRKFAEQFKTDPEAVKESLALDYEEADAKEILQALQVPGSPAEKPKVKNTAVDKADHPHYKWFDEFDARIQKREVINPYTTQRQTIITGWELTKRKHPKFIEPHLAKDLNAFADGFDTLGVGNLLALKGERNLGDVITYEQWATEQGKDLAKDINIILSKN